MYLCFDFIVRNYRDQSRARDADSLTFIRRLLSILLIGRPPSYGRGSNRPPTVQTGNSRIGENGDYIHTRWPHGQ